jgi:diacylglycerol kinase (ATP)
VFKGLKGSAMKKERPERFSMKSRLGSFKFAINGLRALIKNEHNSRIHLFAAIVAIMAGILLKINLVEWSLIIVVMGIVFLAELFNSAMEALSDFVDPDRNELIRLTKDYSAAAVLVSAFVALAVGCIIFIPKIIAL